MHLIAFIEMCNGKQTAPTPLAFFLPLCSAEDSDEMASRRATMRFPPEVGSKEVSIMKSLTFTQWYRILRAHHQWTVFQSIQYALWLTR